MSYAMNSGPLGLSPKEDGELEDGEICDDEAEESIPVRLGEGNRRGGGGGPPRNGLPRQHQPHFHHRMTYNMGPHVHNFPPNHMQQCGPSGPELPPPPGPPPLLPPPQLLPPPLMPHPPGHGPHGELNPRNNFWERSHGTLGRFRHRGMTNGGRGGWNRGGRGGGRAPPGRHGPGDGHGNIESPSRKQKVVVRSVARKMVSKSEAADESFEDLLSKYKQIQLELECIRKEETMALEPHSFSVREEMVENGSTTEHAQSPEVTVTPLPDKEEENLVVTRVFQAFNIKPLRQKLPCTVNLDQSTEDREIVIIDDEPDRGMDLKDLNVSEERTTVECVCCSGEEPEDNEKMKKCPSCSGSSASSEESVPPSEKLPKVEEEDLSELQLRLLALQSASKKWHQKEQQVMKKSRDKITKDIQDKSTESSPAASRQRVTTRSATLAAAGRTKTGAQSLQRERDKTKTGGRPADRDRAKIGKVTPERARASNKSKKTPSPGSTVKQTFRKQQVRNWKLQQQKEEKRQHEEDERRKREEEIRRIRDLSNQDEQYNRFMKLVGGKMQTRSKSRDGEHRKSCGKTVLDSSGNLYQYDNYDEVAMDTDSETSSPVPSPTLFASDDPGSYPPVPLFMTDFPHHHLHAPLTGSPPPPPLPPPPDDLERPPKPPFADEEEEEEMLLRKTCLMSMATKRVCTTEEKTSSGPPSPSSAPPAGTQQPTRGNLSTVNLNMVQQPRSSKFLRGHHHSRAALVLPRHKSVVISLKDSDDSDSDVETSSSTQSMFGGLEFMIKEARRTVEAAKPKATAGPEKENNPVRTPEALPEAKKVEYRLLKEEIAREKQKRLNPTPHIVASAQAATTDSTQDSEQKSAAELKLIEVEQKLIKQRSLLQRDEVLLKQLLLQEQKKNESLRAAEAKVSKLREQLLASEKIVSANKTLLKKLQEQVHRVEHRVTLKKSVQVKLEQELLKAQEATGQGAKRKSVPDQKKVSKMQRVRGAALSSERHLADLIKQKQLLQRLESEYALKIQKLKEAQALRNRSVPVDAPVDPPPRVSTPPNPQSQSVSASPFTLPQPSLHDLTQDKLTLDSDDIPDANEPEPEPEAESSALLAPIYPRRRSLIQSGSTKPHLEQLTSTPVKDGGSAKPSKTTSSPTEPSEVIAGLDVDALKQSYQEGEQLGELLLQELQKIGAHVDDTPVGKVVAIEPDSSTAADMKPVSFGPYHSPLLAFRSYRFSPYYRTKEKLSLSSVTFSNTIESNNTFCRFDLTGTCNDDDCRWQHMRDCTYKGNQLFQDILSYDLSLISCSELSSSDHIGSATEKYMKKLFGSNSDGMSVDQKAVLLVHKVNESRRHNPPFTTCKEPRLWRPRNTAPINAHAEEDSEDETTAGNMTTTKPDGEMQTDLSDVCVTSEDKRYFISETDDISNLESSVLESPCDTQLWIKLAFKYLNQNKTSPAECLEAALNTLSRALENNCENPEVWSHYLALFSRRGSREEVQEMCEMAVEHAPDYRVWWSYLNMERSFEGKDYVCERLLNYLLTESSSGVTEKLSFQLTEALLYRVHLNVFTGRKEGALAILQNNLKSVDERSVTQQVTASDRALLWLSYIHLMEFSRLPADLFDPSESGPSRLVSREDFLLPWRTQQDVSTSSNILIDLFHDAIAQCSEENVSVGERTVSCLSLHLNLVYLHKLLDRLDEGVALCESVLRVHPESCRIRDALVDLHIRRGEVDRAVSIWLHALVECPNNAEVFYNSCKFLMSQNKSSAIAPLLRGFVLSLCEDEQCKKEPLDVLRHILGFPSNDLLPTPNVRKELDDHLNQQSSYLHLIHCRWQWLHGSEQDTVEAFERALGSVLQLEELQRLWMDYLEFTSRNPRLLSDLLLRCLSTVPSRLEVPFNPSEFWTCYHFHNKVVSFYLSCVSPEHHSTVLERLRTCMPNNIELALRFLRQDLLDGNLEDVKLQARMLTNSAPKCLSSWKIAIAVETELKQRSEMRRLLTQALQKLPLCAALWKHLLQVEAVGAPVGVSDRLRRLLLRSQEVGVSLFEVRPAQTDV